MNIKVFIFCADPQSPQHAVYYVRIRSVLRDVVDLRPLITHLSLHDLHSTFTRISIQSFPPRLIIFQHLSNKYISRWLFDWAPKVGLLFF